MTYFFLGVVRDGRALDRGVRARAVRVRRRGVRTCLAALDHAGDDSQAS